MSKIFTQTIICPITDKELIVKFECIDTPPTYDEPAGDYYFSIISINGEKVCETEHLTELEIERELDDYSDSWIPEKEEQQEIEENKKPKEYEYELH